MREAGIAEAVDVGHWTDTCHNVRRSLHRYHPCFRRYANIAYFQSIVKVALPALLSKSTLWIRTLDLNTPCRVGIVIA